MVEVIRLAIQLAVPSTGVFSMLFNLPNSSKILKNTAFALLVLGMGATSLPGAQAQGYTSFGGKYTGPISARPVDFIGSARDVLQRCQVFGDCTAARLRKGKVRPVSKKVLRQLEANGFEHTKTKNRSFFTLKKK